MADLRICDDEHVRWFSFEIKWRNCSWLKKRGGGGRKKLVPVIHRYLLTLGLLAKKKSTLGGLTKRISTLIGGTTKNTH